MKLRFISLAAIPRHVAATLCLVALALGTLVPAAQAGKWVQKEIKWHLTSVGTPTNPTGIYNRDNYTPEGYSTRAWIETDQPWAPGQVVTPP